MVVLTLFSHCVNQVYYCVLRMTRDETPSVWALELLIQNSIIGPWNYETYETVVSISSFVGFLIQSFLILRRALTTRKVAIRAAFWINPPIARPVNRILVENYFYKKIFGFIFFRLFLS